jgi:hypothetical protein
VAVLDWLQQLLGGGDPEAAGAAQASTAMQPMTQPWLDKVLSGEMARSGIQDVNDAFASRDPVALAGSFGPSPLGIRAFHGSPHSFDQFDLGKIGTGEGAQAYGHGLYFAESEPTALSYRNALSGNKPLSQWEGSPLQTRQDWFGTIDKVAQDDWRLAKMIEAAGGPGGVRGAVSTFEPYTRNPGADGAAWAAATKKFLEGAGPDAKGHMYEVDINAKPEDFLNWDKPLSAQPQVQQKLADAGVINPRSSLLEVLDRANTQTGSQIYESPKLVPGGYRDPKAAAAALNEMGIPGVRYSDQGSRGYQIVPPSYTGEQWRVVNHNNQVVAKTPTEQGVQDWMAQNATSNYAVFDDKIIQIMRRYGLLPPLAAGGLLAAPGQGEAAQP